MEAPENQVVNNHEETPDRGAWHAPQLVELAVRETESGDLTFQVETGPDDTIYAPS
jgi:hypothetical protein